MSVHLEKRPDAADRSRISLSSASDVRYWMQALDVSEPELRAAVAQMGGNANAVRLYLSCLPGRPAAALFRTEPRTEPALQAAWDVTTSPSTSTTARSMLRREANEAALHAGTWRSASRIGAVGASGRVSF